MCSQVSESGIGAPSTDTPVEQLVAIAAAGGVLNRKQRRVVERHQAKAKEELADMLDSGAEPTAEAEVAAPAPMSPADELAAAKAEIAALKAAAPVSTHATRATSWSPGRFLSDCLWQQTAPDTPRPAPATPKPDDASVGTLAELAAIKASGTPLNRKQRRAFERLSAE